MTTVSHHREDVRLQGTSICPGIGIGRAHLVDQKLRIPQDRIDAADAGAEQERYMRAVETARCRLPEHIAAVHSTLSDEAQAILSVHQAILGDDLFHQKVRDRIALERRRSEHCLNEEATALIVAFDGMRDPYLQARAEDIRDMAFHLLEILEHNEADLHPPLSGEEVLVSQHFHSSHAFLAHRGHAQGYASEGKALASHAAILLKGFGIPAVGNVSGLIGAAREGDQILVDGNHGSVIVRPSRATELEFDAQRRAAKSAVLTGDVTPCLTKDGVPIDLMANIENPDQVHLMLEHRLNGIGLFRSEFMIPFGGFVPSEEEQCAIYRRLIRASAGRPIVFRTFDIGGDKQIGLAPRCAGPNPALGARGIRRHLLLETAELHAQLRALLRAAQRQPIRILIPMVTTLSDVICAKQVLTKVREELRMEHIEQPVRVAFGTMIETPAAAFAVQEILEEVDFISVGTNDLLQYFMAADRDNERVIHYNDPTAPPFLSLLRSIIQQAKRIGREADVAVCGEIASDPQMVPYLLEPGYRTFSIAPVAAEPVRKACAATSTQSVQLGSGDTTRRLAFGDSGV